MWLVDATCQKERLVGRGASQRLNTVAGRVEINGVFNLRRPDTPVGISRTVFGRLVQLLWWIELRSHWLEVVKRAGVVKRTIEVMMKNLARPRDVVPGVHKPLHDGFAIAYRTSPVALVAVDPRSRRPQAREGGRARRIARWGGTV